MHYETMWELDPKKYNKMIAKLLKRKKKTPRQKLIVKMDDLTRVIVRARDGDTCQCCGNSEYGINHQWSHVLARPKGCKLRWHLSNSLILCDKCHKWWHAFPLVSTYWFRENYPERAEEIAIISRHEAVPIPICELESMVEEYKKLNMESHLRK